MILNSRVAPNLVHFYIELRFLFEELNIAHFLQEVLPNANDLRVWGTNRLKSGMHLLFLKNRLFGSIE